VHEYVGVIVCKEGGAAELLVLVWMCIWELSV